ncbi:DUF445 domain-containing protein [Haliangium sp.]|uniref:DUF445 domain-containing protein n=1 Tax=Haliangium sp. TaxID=2663208 RepID=UPI003D0FC42B
MSFAFEPMFLLIPLISAFVGWLTNVVAVRMMFWPIDFVGVWKLGWQGIVPANAGRMAGKSTDIITEKLINLRELFEDFDAKSFAGQNLDAVVDETVEQVIAETAAKYAPEMWEGANDTVKGHLRAMIRADVEKVMVDILADIGGSIEDILKLKEIVIAAADRDRALIGNMFMEVGRQEFGFIKLSGAYFGLPFGLVQLVAFMLYDGWWVLPFFGFFVGYLTNLVAVKLIFRPQQPTKIGPVTVQGLFHKRQEPVARAFAELVATRILNSENMVEHMTQGACGQRLFGIVERHLDALIERYRKNPMIASMIPADKWDEARTELHARIRSELPKPGGFLYVFTGGAVDIYAELADRMVGLSAEEFEGILRPPFQEDEWKLIVAGGVLGLLAGLAQALYFVGEQML